MLNAPHAATKSLLFGAAVLALVLSHPVTGSAAEPMPTTGPNVTEPTAAATVAEYDEGQVLFARRIETLLREKCLGCHGADADEIEGGIDFRHFDTIAAGGDSGEPGIVPGDPESSSIYLASARGEEEFSAMPPKDSEALDEQQLAWMRRWIELGAEWPDDDRIAEIKTAYDELWSAEDGVIVPTSGGLDDHWTNRRYDPAGLWAYQPVSVEPPTEIESESAVSIDSGANDGSSVPTTDLSVDDFINASIPEGLEIADRADRRTLIRRVTFDLTGLPPTANEVTAFIDDPASDADAFATLVDRLLQSPHYGERMAQHWLDVTRYADSSGFANDFERGNAWRYRDYVVRAFNDDKPYDQFVREQIAGDEINPDDPDHIIAPGFLRMGPWELTGMEVAKVARMRFLDDVTNSVGETFLGQSLQCCRCHDHKFDPIPTQDYYSVQAVFATTQLVERNADFLEDENTEGFGEKEYLIQQRAVHQQTLADLHEVLLENAIRWFEDRPELHVPPNAAEEAIASDIAGDASKSDKTSGASDSSDDRLSIFERWNRTVARLSENKRPLQNIFNMTRDELIRQGVDEDQIPPTRVGFTPQQFGMERVAFKGLQRLNWEMDRYQPVALSVYNGHTRSMTEVSSPLRMPADRTEGELEKSVIHTGGDPFAAGAPVSPGVLSVVESQVAADIPETIDGRRTALAEWIANPANPLTTRVIANRVWQWHFGRGIAGNPNNFGSTGKKPTHPELLDYLATELVRNDWSIKSLHRQILLSDAYCRSSRHPDRDVLAELDPNLESYAVFLPRRLSAEELRDSMLHVSGELNPTLGGIPCRPIINSEVALQPRQVMGTFASAWTPNPKPQQRNRRSIYVLKLRGLVDPSLEVFNAPSPDFSCERRDTSTVTPQVFAMFNSANTQSRALNLAKLVTEQFEQSDQNGGDRRQMIQAIYGRMFGRDASPTEVDQCIDHWDRIASLLPPTAPPYVAPPKEVTRVAVEENTGERFSFVETMHAIDDFEPDVQPGQLDRQTRALADVCLVLLNSNEFVYLY